MTNYIYPNFSGGGGGGVSSVTASSPLSSSGGATPNISYVGPFSSDVTIQESGTLGANLILNNTGFAGAEWRVKSCGAADPAGGGSFALQNFSMATTPFCILPSGNIGVNTFSPATTVDISGSFSVSGNTGFFGATPSAQQTGGAATAGGTYSTTEQDMLQKVYNCLRAFGFLS